MTTYYVSIHLSNNFRDTCFLNTAKGSAERMLTKLAGVSGIDRMDETTYDSSEFPKVIFRSNLEYPASPGSRWVETCESCGEELK